MLDYARLAQRLSIDRSREDLDEDELLRLGLTRAVEVVGEAAARVSDSTRRRAHGIPWEQIVGTRHRLIHGYDSVDLDLLWTIITTDLPALESHLEELIAEVSKD
jgi:uncharacterized protein with HEPN domain